MTMSLSSEVEVFRPPSHIKCAYCEKPIFVGDRAVYFHHGVIGRGPKSGQPIVTDGEHTSGESTVHELCIAAFLTMEVVDSAEEVEQAIDSLTESVFGVSYTALAEREEFCAACEEKIGG